MKNRSFFTLTLLLLGITQCFGTVDYLSVNHITTQLYWGDSDKSTGWIGWDYSGRPHTGERS